MNLPIDYEAHFRVPEETGFTREQEEDLAIVDDIQHIIESFEAELPIYAKSEINVFNASKVIRLDRAKFSAANIHNGTVREIIDEILVGWEQDDGLVLEDYKSPDNGSLRVGDVYKKMQEEYFDYD